MLSRDLVTNSLLAEFDVEIADFLIRLDEIFFDFFQCGDLQLIRPGDKSYT
jgi:glutathionyl-hydroquinone reductase